MILFQDIPAILTCLTIEFVCELRLLLQSYFQLGLTSKADVYCNEILFLRSEWHLVPISFRRKSRLIILAFLGIAFSSFVMPKFHFTMIKPMTKILAY